MSNQNVLVSSGKCYTAAGKELGSQFIPCGNDAFGHTTCCGKGDKCLANGACYGKYKEGYGSDLTYWAGCTDSEYKDPVCPDKKVDQPWVALTLCDNTGVWAICSQEGNPSTLQPGSFCSCSDESKATVAFKDKSPLDDVALLPQNTGDSISFFQGHSPTATVPTATGGGGGAGTTSAGGGGGSGTSATNPPPSTSPANGPSSRSPTTSASSRPATTTERGTSASSARSSSGSPSSPTVKPTTVTSTGPAGSVTTLTTSTTDPPSSTGGSSSGGGSSGSSDNSAGGLSNGAAIGIGVGVGMLALLLLGALMLFIRRRRRQRHRRTFDTTDEKTTSGRGSPPPAPKVAEADGRPMKDPGKLRGELGGDTELVANGKPADGTTAATKHRRGPSELDGAAAVPSPEPGAAELPATTIPRDVAQEPFRPLVPAPLQVKPHTTAPKEEPLPAGAGLPPLQGPPEPKAPPPTKPWGAEWRT